jgi:hypothetical protein
MLSKIEIIIWGNNTEQSVAPDAKMPWLFSVISSLLPGVAYEMFSESLLHEVI